MTRSMKGTPAPDFDLPRDGGGTLRLSDLQGKLIVLYFYPKDDTSGCTSEAIDFTRLKEKFSEIGVVIIGMSPDNVKKHDKFKTKHDLDITLVSDEEKTTLQVYGVWVEKSMYGRKYMGVERSTFLIDAAGIIAEEWRKVSVSGHAEDVLAAATRLSS
ncbi:peroxiredoxin [Bartonella rattaustraliani]|uniref:peroxiredoxin n=1 Tax=Bartonella rattaustraliani TaxID=481139 RepID=UPI0003063D3F|nr:peroxiredoxin [Bartonella rattaustraliani]